MKIASLLQRVRGRALAPALSPARHSQSPNSCTGPDAVDIDRGQDEQGPRSGWADTAWVELKALMVGPTLNPKEEEATRSLGVTNCLRLAPTPLAHGP